MIIKSLLIILSLLGLSLLTEYFLTQFTLNKHAHNTIKCITLFIILLGALYSVGVLING